MVLIEILSNFISTEVLIKVGKVLAVLLYLLAIGAIMLTTGRFKEKPFAEKYGYTAMSALNKLFTLFFYKPSTLLNMTLRTNSTTRGYLISNVVVMLLATGASINSLSRMNDITGNYEYFNMNSQIDWANYQNYEDELSESVLFRPLIQSQIIKENHLRLYLPKFKREQQYRDALCGAYEKLDSLNNRENRVLKKDFDLACLKSYYKLSIDDSAVVDPTFVLKRHQLDDRMGFQTIIPLDSLSSGQHVLKIETHYKNDDGAHAIRYIPFYKD